MGTVTAEKSVKERPAFTDKIAFVVPTKDRPDDLRRMLASVQVQSVHPDQIIIVDASRDPAESITGEFPPLKIDYVHVYPPSLSRQRNAGMQHLRASTTLAGYLDDDLVLEKGALESMLSFWEAAPDDVGGAAFNIMNERQPYGTWLKAPFLIDSRKRGVVLPSGYHTMICPVSETIYVRWIFGGATVWRKEVIDEFSYDEWFEGTGYLEDVDYSYRVGHKYKLAIVAGARVQHLSPPIRRDRNYLLGKWQVVNRLYFVRKHRELSEGLCYWALIGQLLINLGKPFVELDLKLLDRVLGNLAGLFSDLVGKTPSTSGTLK